MSMQVGFTLRGRNPDVLTCIANLSNDEVFTPPEFANRMLDTLADAWAADHSGANIWTDKKVKFLDPFTKSGVFLREITRRLNEGLAAEMPDLQVRVDHILTKQVFGIGITHLTSLLARRSLYCSKHANGEHSVAGSFTTESGNIWFERVEHAWDEAKCKYCGAPKATFDRKKGLENHAYAFIHADNIKTRMTELFGDDMQFDVIVGNPPYQMTGGAGGSSDSSIYHLFVQQALKLEPRYTCMVIPSRWMAGGRGLDEFRAQMLNSGHLRSLADFPDSGDAFPGVQIKGGVCYFLWDAAHQGTCDVTRVAGGEEHLQKNRQLGEFDVFVRDERALGILRKVLSKKEPSVLDLVSGDTPFGIATNFEDWNEKGGPGRIALHLISRGKRMSGFTKRANIRKNIDLLDAWKVLVPEAYGAGETFPHQILGKEIVAAPPSACTQSYLVASPFRSERAAKSFASYYRTRLFRFLVSLRKITQHALRSTYSWVPQQSWDKTWTDELLYKKYGITKDEIAFIESMIRPMDAELFDV
ncbi:Eco57I restriction-modification methylase domain-containing protein [Parvibaculum sp.]|uniref:Eco57I restriction-modification methylase domain-containing protein n=1 Tax=Parvibaculum sp. TaxID=2024848 RepID=UPI001DD52163|nr:Eco57I restriction-modification methylase domain-containing protein [Parvibaculum sp.]MBX3489915.1 Eco57I restriction-modification methylase domain-containing protein [Parvibaculum sp.]MCW5726097.1 Eco57I restriction-modification methylase domain-containing protein [Parvibaculum sp.]